MRLLGVDVGSTFTDLVLFDAETGGVTVHKVPSTPEDQSHGVLTGVREICQTVGVTPAQLDFLTHGTTVATNALLTHRGAKTGMIATKGFRDVVYIGRHHRPLNYSILLEIPWHDRQPVLRRYRKEVTERVIPPEGQALVPLDEAETIRVIEELKQEGIESIAVCFLFSFLNPDHEERVAQLIREHHPGCYVSTSSSIFPQFREFERFVTTAINASLAPTVSRYIANLDRALHEAKVSADLHVMQSNSGLATTAVACEKPVTLLLSGPAAGVAGGVWTAGHLGHERLVTLDMGGTSTDLGVVTEKGVMEAAARDTWIAGFPVMVPIIDIHTIGAGGGSIAYLDAGGALHVGPQSAGANPGPACYNLGGVAPTITDANVVTGRLRPEYFLGGRMLIEPALSRQALAQLGEKLDTDEIATAAAILQIANENMAAAIRTRTVQRGLDPQDFLLVAFGGAGPLHAADVARLLRVPRVLIPNFPGITSALGLLVVDIRYDDVRTVLRSVDEVSASRINQVLGDLSSRLVQQLHRDGCSEDRIRVRKTADVRYIGQGYEVRIELPAEPFGEDASAQIRQAFEKKHEEEYNQVFPGALVELVNLRATAFGAIPHLAKRRQNGTAGKGDGRLKTEDVYFPVDGGMAKLPTVFYDRTCLKVGQRVAGPAIVVQMDSTSVVPQGASCAVDEYGNLLISLEVE